MKYRANDQPCGRNVSPSLITFYGTIPASGWKGHKHLFKTDEFQDENRT